MMSTPEGRVTPGEPVLSAEAHNKEVEARELAEWAKQPDCWHVYVHEPHGTGPDASVRIVTTWMGTTLGTITRAHTFRHNFGGRMTTIRFKGTNGATYAGRFGPDWSQLCRVRKVKGGAR